MYLDDAGQIGERLERLERENMRLGKSVRRANRVIALLAVISLVVICAGAMQGQPAAELSRLTIIGPNGKPRILLGVNNENVAGIDLLDAGGDSHIRLQVEATGTLSAIMMKDIKDQLVFEGGIRPKAGGGYLIINGMNK